MDKQWETLLRTTTDNTLLAPNGRIPSVVSERYTVGYGCKDEGIIIVDEDNFYSKKTAMRIKKSGFTNVLTRSSIEVIDAADFQTAKLLVVDLSAASPFDTFFSTLQIAKFRGFRGHLVLFANAVDYQDLYSAVSLGVSDIWIKGKGLHIDAEISNLLARKRNVAKENLTPESITELGFFRSVGLTKMELKMVAAMANGFPRQRDIALTNHLSAAYVNKLFSRIYEKLGPTAHVDTPVQLGFLITVCSMFV